MKILGYFIVTILALTLSYYAVSAELLIRPTPQIIQQSEGDFVVLSTTKIVIVKDFPAYIKASAIEIAEIIGKSAGKAPEIVEVDKLEINKGDIIIAPYEWLSRQLGFIEPMPQGIIRPQPLEGYNIRILPANVYVAGNSERGCFMGMQTLIQIARQGKKSDTGFKLPGLLISDFPDHGWRSLQHPLGVYGSTYDRGEHRYRHITKVDLLERSIRLAAYMKMSGFNLEVGTGMTYKRHPEIFVEGFSTNEQEKLRSAVNLAKSLGLEFIAFQNVSAGHDIWNGPYAYAVPNSEIYMETIFDLFDETIETLRPQYFHIGMDEDVAQDFDGNQNRTVEMHKKVLLDCHKFLIRRGVSMLAWNDGIELVWKDVQEIPRSVIVLPWYYGGHDYTGARRYIDAGFRIMCSPWSQWHVDNDQFYSVYASSYKTEKLLGMAGTIWYPIPPDAENDYRRCLVKAAMAFWSPLQAGKFPDDKEYWAPSYKSISGAEYANMKSVVIPQDQLDALIKKVVSTTEDSVEAEAAREKLFAAGATAAIPLLKAISANPESISPYAEGTLRRIAREPRGDVSLIIKALEETAGAKGALRDLSLELLGQFGNAAFLEKQDVKDSVVCFAMGVSGDKKFLPVLLETASQTSAAQINALNAIGRLNGKEQLISLKASWKNFSDDAREAYAKAVAMNPSEETIPLLGELIADANRQVRFRAAIGLGATRSKSAGPFILKLLDDKKPEVFKVGLWWCTDTFILEPKEYFPKLIARLNPDEDKDILRPILHAITLMWDPGLGQWLAKGEDASKRINYAKLDVWKDQALLTALNKTMSHRDPRLAIDSMMIIIKMGAKVDAPGMISALEKFKPEDKQWFCIRVRDSREASAAPVMKGLWKNGDRLTHTFILQFCTSIRTPETFQIALDAFTDLPDTDEQKISAAGVLSAHIEKLDATAKKVVPIAFEYYNKGGFELRASFDGTLSKLAGKESQVKQDDTPEQIQSRLDEWKKWWESAQKEIK
jgi:hypothetical protein